jgi:hypothetical protein
MQNANVFLQNPYPSFATRNQRDLLGHSFTPRIITRPPYRVTGNSAPSVVSRCLHRLCTAGKSGTATIQPQRKRAVALLVTGGHRRHPASGLNWGPSFAKTNGPSFHGAYYTECRNVKSVVPRFLGCAHILVVAGSRRLFLSIHFKMRGWIKL